MSGGEPCFDTVKYSFSFLVIKVNDLHCSEIDFQLIFSWFEL